MFRSFLFILILIIPVSAFGQTGSELKVRVINKDTKEAVADARVSIKDTEIAATTNMDGVASLFGIADGPQTVEVASLGYETAELRLTLPLADASVRTVELTINNEVGEVTVSSTRTGREIEAEPTRVEAIDEEEVDEKINMRPANVSMVLNESTGIKVQQTSATTNTQSVRIQGLDGRYTQLLKDGFPAYGGFSGSLSVLEIPPLDLKQVEIIKGPSGTLYGAGAIAGVVNFIPKEPEDEPSTSIVLNLTSALGSDVSLFHSRKAGAIGYTFLGSYNYQREYDVDDDDFTELPRTNSVALSPRLFVYADEKTRFSVGNSFSMQKRTGGDIFAIRDAPDGIHQYFEKNDSLRNVTTFSFDRLFSDGGRFNAKQSLAFFSRELDAPGYRFKGDQFNSYTDIAYFRAIGKNAFVVGFNAVHDRFREDVTAPGALDRSETRTTFGAFVQDTVDLTDHLALEAGFRLDHVREYGTFALPRVSLLYRFTDNFTTRVGYGLGYKTPTVFTEDAEELLFRNVVGIGNKLKAERSQGGTLDFNYRGSIGEKVGYSVNQLFFYTEISDPLVLELSPDDLYRFRNERSPIVSRGFETNAKLTYGVAKLFVGYTFTDAKAGYLAGDRRLTLTPRHRVNSSLVFEREADFKAGAEFYYGSRQVLDDRSLTPSTATFGLFGEKTFGKFSVFFNAENITDERQGRYSPVVTGPHDSPTFAQIWTHLEGRIFNGGMKLRF